MSTLGLGEAVASLARHSAPTQSFLGTCFGLASNSPLPSAPDLKLLGLVPADELR